MADYDPFNHNKTLMLLDNNQINARAGVKSLIVYLVGRFEEKGVNHFDSST